MEYIIREIPVVDNKMDGKSVIELLKNDYKYLYESMLNENYNLHFGECNMFMEIIFESKVVGFMTFSADAANISLSDVFILPDFRGNHLFFMNFSMILASGNRVSITQPTRGLVEILIHYGLAAKLTDSLVATAVSFDMIADDDSDENEYMSNLYDLNLCSTILLEDISTPGICEIGYHSVLKEDDEEYNACEFRNSINLDDYLEDIKECFLKRHLEFQEVLVNLKNNLPKPVFDFKEIVGEDEGLSDYMINMVNEGLLSKSNAFEIKRRLKKEYANGDVRDDGIFTRLLYLINGVDLSEDMELFLSNISNSIYLCPDCYQPINISDSYCSVCGFNISGGKTLDYDEVIKGLSKDEYNIVDLRNDSSDNQTIIDALLDIYSNGDADSLDMHDLNMPDIDDIGQYHLKSEIDLSIYFDNETNYIKNYSRIIPIVDFEKTEKYSLKDGIKSSYYSYDMFRVLKLLKINPKIDEVCDALNLLNDAGEIKARCFMSGVIESKNYGEDIYSHILDSNRVVDLKDILRQNNLKVSGNKADLATRIIENGLYTQIGDDEYILSEHGEDLLLKLGWINFYELGMEMFDFSDLEIYLVQNNHTSFNEGAIKYLNEHLNKAYKTKDYYLLYDVLATKAIFYVYYEDYKKALMEELKLFQLKLNPIFLSDDEMEAYDVLEENNINNIKILSQILDISNLKKIFNRTWSYMKFDKRIINKKMSLNYLNQAIGMEDVNDLSDEIFEKYFGEKYVG